jgi:hypothetical protein
MEIVLTNCEHVIRPSRGGLPPSYTIGTIRVTADNQDEIWDMIAAMQQWANNTFEPVVVEREEDGSLVVTPVDNSDPELEEIEIDPLSGMPI